MKTEEEDLEISASEVLFRRVDLLVARFEEAAAED